MRHSPSPCVAFRSSPGLTPARIPSSAGKSVEVPIYDFVTHSRVKDTVTMYGANVIIFEGILAFCSQAIRDLLDVKVFVVEDADVRLARRCVRFLQKT